MNWAVGASSGTQIDTSLQRGAPAGPVAPVNPDQLAGVAGAPAQTAPAPAVSPTPATDPLEGAAQ